MEIKNRFLFNFAASYSGGGFKRLYEYAKWFNQNGGAMFIIHTCCERLRNEFPNNYFFLANRPRYQRIVNDCSYLDNVEKEIGQPDLYYSYGIPIYDRFGKLNWFHLSNVLPLGSKGIPLSVFDRLKLGFLGWRIKKNFHNADVISAESNYSLGLINVEHTEKLFLSVNGSDDELRYVHKNTLHNKENIATVLGTYSYKDIKDSCLVYEMLRKMNKGLRLVIIGNEKSISKDLLHKNNIITKGVLKRREVVECLSKTKFYISTTHIENSYNAASEGVFFADESYISDIGPHRELLTGMQFKKISVPNMSRLVLHIKRDNVTSKNLKTWEEVITDMINRVYATAENLHL